MTDCLVLVVDDNPDDLRIIGTYLRHYGYVVLEVESGERALRLAANWRPAIAVIDLVMPGLSGPQIAAAIRSDPELERLPLIAVSGYREHEVAAEHSGFDVFLEKPCASIQLLAAIRELLPREPIEA